MKRVWPHQFFRLDFDQMLKEGERQERIHTANKGEYALVQAMHAYFATNVLPLILNNDWVYDAASTFASRSAMDCFRYLRLGGQEVYETQKRLLDINKKVVDLLARAHLEGAAPLAGRIDLPKASDFFDLLDLEKLSEERRAAAVALYHEVRDHESMQVLVTLRAIRDNYEVTLPRVLAVVRRAMKVSLNLTASGSDSTLTGISETLTWYEDRIDSHHPLYAVLGRLRDFYKVARNVASHHQGMEWDSERDTIILTDRGATLRVHVHEFQQGYRYLIYLCELGVRGILSAFCERERGTVSNSLVREYIKTFPSDFPEGEQGVVTFSLSLHFKNLI
jgi:hypothetical protein